MELQFFHNFHLIPQLLKQEIFHSFIASVLRERERENERVN